MCINVSCNEREIFVILQDGLVLGNQCQRFVVAAEIIQVVCEVHDALAVAGQLGQHAFPEFRGLSVIALEEQVALTLPLYLRVGVHLGVRALQPLLRQVQVVRFQGRVRSSGNDQRIGRHQLVGRLIILLGAAKIPLRGIQIPEREIGHVVLWMCGNGALEE